MACHRTGRGYLSSQKTCSREDNGQRYAGQLTYPPRAMENVNQKENTIALLMAN